MLRSITKKLEIELLYGQVGYGVVSAATAAPNTITINTSHWAPGIWAGSEKMPIEIRDITGVTSRGNFEISAVDFDLRKLTLTTDPVAAGVVATDVVWHKGAYGNEFAGIHKIITNTGTLFNIDASVYSLWKGNEFSAGSAVLSFQKLQDSIARGVEKGLDGDVTVLVNVRTWSDLLQEQAALRMYDQSYKSDEMQNGAKSIKFHAQNGMMEIIPSIYIKEGFSYVLYLDDMVRIGSSDVSFKRPGKPDEYFLELPSHMGFELRAFCDMALFTHSPGKNVLIKDIVN